MVFRWKLYCGSDRDASFLSLSEPVKQVFSGVYTFWVIDKPPIASGEGVQISDA